MGLIFNRSGDITERTRWNLSFSGLSLSHKRGRLTLNTRGRSNFRIARGWNVRVHTATAYFLWVMFFVFDFVVLLLGGAAWLVVAAGEGSYYGVRWLLDRKSDNNLEKKKEEITAGKNSLPPIPTPPGEKVKPMTKEISSLTMDHSPGTYDLKTVDDKVYEVILRATGENGVLALDNIFGKKSFSPTRPYFALIDVKVELGKPAKMVISKGEDKQSTVYTKKIVAIQQVD